MVLAAVPLLFALSPSLSSAAILPAACTTFVDVTVVPMDRERLLPHTTVLVRDGRISEVMPAASAVVPKDCTRIDGRHRFLIPGLVDTHAHLFGYMRGGADDIEVEKQILRLFLANGVTTIAVMEGTPAILSLRDDLLHDRVLGPRIYSAGRLIQMPNSGAPPGRRTFTTPADVRAEVIAEKRAGYDFIKVHGDLPAETYAALLETARQQDIRVVGHVPNNLGIDAALTGGQSMITHAESYLDSYFRFNRDLPTDSVEIDSMVRAISVRTARAGTWVQPTLSVFRQIVNQIADLHSLTDRPEMRYMPPASITDWYPPINPYLRNWTVRDLPELNAQYSIMRRLVRGLRDAGVPLLAGTDDMVPVQLPGYSMRNELEQLNEAGLTPFEALQAATSNPARFLGSTDNAGTVVAGKTADLVLLDANPLDDINNAFRQDGVMLRGRWFPEAVLQRALTQQRKHATPGTHSPS